MKDLLCRADRHDGGLRETCPFLKPETDPSSMFLDISTDYKDKSALMIWEVQMPCSDKNTPMRHLNVGFLICELILTPNNKFDC